VTRRDADLRDHLVPLVRKPPRFRLRRRPWFHCHPIKGLDVPIEVT
jgi:hypothetical protein